jgi:hypothetical protein
MGPMSELTTTSPYVHSRVDSNTLTMGNPMPELTVQYSPCRDFVFGLRSVLREGVGGGGGIGGDFLTQDISLPIPH